MVITAPKSACRYLYGIFFLLLTASCGVKNFPKETPFVYQNKIDIINPKLTNEEKIILRGRLNTQLNDSLQVKVKQQFIFFNKVIDPPRFDSTNLTQSIENIDIYLKTIGYYNSKSTVSTKNDTVHRINREKKQIRVSNHFKVETGPLFLIESANYELVTDNDSTPARHLQEICNRHLNESFLRKGLSFTEERMLSDIERLVVLFRNNGYLQFTRDMLYAEVDTVFKALLNPMLDPIERISLLEEAEKRRKQPVVEINIKLIPGIKRSALIPYKIGTVKVYPSVQSFPEDTITNREIKTQNLIIRTKRYEYTGEFLESHVHIHPGDIYKLNKVNQTLDDLNTLGIWQFIKLDPQLSNLSSDTGKVDFLLTMIPAKKYSFTAGLESVFNQTQQTASATAGNLIGLGLNLGIRNKNFSKQGISHTNTIRAGVESGIGGLNSGLQAIELTYSNNLTMPKLLLLGKKWDDRFMFKRTIISSNLSSINRNINNRGLFSLTSIGSSFGWQIRNSKNEIYSFKPLNLEYVNLYNISSGFKLQLDTTPFLRYSFTQGLIIGSVFSYTRPNIQSARKPNHVSYFRVGIEESGALFGRLKRLSPIFDKDLFEYIKAEIEYKHEIRQRKTSWAFRAIAGAGYLYDDTTSMPFFKQFTGGGPNSMRAWPLRSIGPGTSPLEKRSGRGQFFSRSGDILFEANAEFRYDIATIIPNTFVIRGALFTDIGNIWNFKKESNRNNDTVVFNWRNFYRDLSVSAGTGFRFDFIGLFMLRFDLGLRVKNPALPFSETNYGWRWPSVNFARVFGTKEEHRQWRYENFNFSIGINYPF
jgi:outer membrane protein assembly factor BamA